MKLYYISFTYPSPPGATYVILPARDKMTAIQTFMNYFQSCTISSIYESTATSPPEEEVLSTLVNPIKMPIEDIRRINNTYKKLKWELLDINNQ